MNEEHNAPTPQTVVRQSPQNALGIPLAIIIAGALIAVAVFFSGSQKAGVGTQVAKDRNVEQETPEMNVAPVTKDDHILGNPNAPIVIIEYSDFDCPFCKNFHDTMNQVMAEYGDSGKVAWVYRHFPIKQLHPNAELISEASVCVASIGGNEAFWKFANFVFNERSTNAQTDVTKLPGYAESSGVSQNAYTACLESGKFKQQIQDSIASAVDAGARGTPYSILMAGGEQGVINGAQQYATVKQMIDTVLTQLEG